MRAPNYGRRDEPSHAARPELDGATPVHVTMRTRFRGMRMYAVYKVFHRVLRVYLGNPYFRIVHISIQSNHLHLIVEAADKLSLSRGMQGFAIRAAKALNALRGHGGRVFKTRYHAKPIRDASHARNAISYVLNNFRRHSEDRDAAAHWRYDFYSSAASYLHWEDGPWRYPSWYDPLPVTPPRTDLLASVRDLSPRRSPDRLHRTFTR